MAPAVARAPADIAGPGIAGPGVAGPSIRAILVAACACAIACRPGPRVGSPCATSRAFAPFDEHAAAPPAPPPPDGALDAIVAWYQDHARAGSVPGTGCPFAPTCSVYARDALHRYGPLAVILIVDRLIVREHPAAAAYYPTTCVAHTTRLVDGVP